MVKFYEDTHSYIFEDGTHGLSVTTALKKVKEPFIQVPAAEKAIRNSRSKWHKMLLDEVINAWNAESKRSTDLGSWYHKVRENQLYTQGNELAIVLPDIREGIKYASDQKLQDNTIYPEHLVYLQSAGICGQADYVEVRKNILTIRDYKSSKEIKRSGYVQWDGSVSKLLPPFQHLDNCEFNIYALQLSIYCYIITRHNPTINVGKLIIEHVKFVEEALDKYGYPIYAKDSNGDYIVKEVEIIEVPYMKREIVTLLTWLKEQKAV